MPNFTTQITDANVIAELPDVSVLAGLYADDLTLSDLTTSMNSVSFRKKFQALLEFKMSEASKDSMYDALKDGYIAFETNNGRTVTELNGNVFVDDRLVAFTVDGFADGLFEDDTFATLFFTEDVMDVIFGSGDESFLKSIASVSNFWDKLLLNTTVTDHVVATYPDAINGLISTVEIAYVKYVASITGLDVQKYKTIEYLAEDSPAMDAIYLTPEARALESDSPFGIRARLMYVFNSTDLSEIANSDDNVTAVENDPSLREIIVDIDAVLALPVGSKIRNLVINNDGYFGAIAAERLSIETTISLSNIFYDETFALEREAFVRDNDLVNLLFESELYSNFEQQFFTAFTAQNVSSQKFAFKVNEVANTLTAHYTSDTFEVKKIELSLASFTETKAGAVSAVDTSERIFFTPYTFADGTMLGVQVDHGIEFNNPSNYNLYNELLDDTFDTVLGGNGHILAIASDGRVVSSKFFVDLNLSTETIENITVTENNAFIKTAETFHAIGNFGEDKNDIVNNLIVNKDSVSKAVYFNGNVLGLGTDKKVKIIDASGMSDFSAASALDVDDIMVIAGKFVVLATDGALSEIKIDNTIVSITADVGNVVYSQDAIVCTVAGSERAIFSNSGSWLVYDFNVNTL